MTEGFVNQDQAVLGAAPIQSMPNQELITQDKANYLITKAKESGYEKGMKEAMAQLQIQTGASNQAMQNATVGMTQEQILDLIEKKADEKITVKLQQMQIEQTNNNVAREIVGKFTAEMEAGKAEYGDDFEKAVRKLKMENSPEVVALLTTIPNMKDVVHEFSKKPRKLAEIELHLSKGRKEAAEDELQALSKSIAENRKAKASAQASQTKSPLSQLKPSTAHVDGSEWTQSGMKEAIRALRKKA